jgi:ComF family protein
VHHLKYRNGRALALPLGSIMATWCDAHALRADVIVPVPLHPDRLRERGYNQAALLARELERRVGLPVRESVLSRVRYTRSQMELDAEARRRNVQGAFRCADGRVRGQHVLLVDDVCTTGATIAACADALRAGGAARVEALTLARAP